MRVLILILTIVTVTSVVSCQNVQDPLDVKSSQSRADGFIAEQTAAPTLRVTSGVFPPLLVSGTASDPLIIDFPAGESFQVCWSEHPPTVKPPWGNTDKSSECSTARTLYFGTHTLKLESKDGLTRAAILIIVILPEDKVSVDVGSMATGALRSRTDADLWCVLFGTEGLSVGDVEPLRLGGASPVSAEIRDVGRPGRSVDDCAFTNRRRDGEDDLVMTFKLPRGWSMAPRGGKPATVLFWARVPFGFGVGRDCIAFRPRP